jgi:hypothetical protein
LHEYDPNWAENACIDVAGDCRALGDRWAEEPGASEERVVIKRLCRCQPPSDSRRFADDRQRERQTRSTLGDVIGVNYHCRS